MDDAPPPFDIPPEDWAATPPCVQSAFRALLSVTAAYQQQLVVLQDVLADQQAVMAQLQARLNQTVQNSSKPPSSDPPLRHRVRPTRRAAALVAPKLVTSATSAHACA